MHDEVDEVRKRIKSIKINQNISKKKQKNKHICTLTSVEIKTLGQYWVNYIKLFEDGPNIQCFMDEIWI